MFTEEPLHILFINQNSYGALADDMGVEREILEALLKETRISATVHVR